jgi:AraC family transcriptional regulator
MTDTIGLCATDAFRSAIPQRSDRANVTANLGDLTVCNWRTPWIEGFELPANDDLVIALHRYGECDVRAIGALGVSQNRSRPGDITCIPSDRDYRFRVAGEVEFQTVHVPRARLSSVSAASPSLPIAPSLHFAFHDAFLGACVEALVGEASARGPRSDEFIESVSNSMLIHLRRFLLPPDDGRQVQGPSRPIARAVQLIEANLSRSVRLEEMAEAAGISRSHFARLFRAEMGVSPHRYQCQRRVELAKELLDSSSLGLVDIAIELGFCSQSHFTQVFHSQVGMPPRRYREQR